MDIQSLISRFAPALTQQLVAKSGFTQPEAQGFVPGLIKKVVGLTQGGSFDLKSFLGGEVSGLVSKLDVPALARSAGIDTAKAEAGAREVVPTFLKQLSAEPGGIDGLLGQGEGGAKGLIAKVGKLFGA